MPEVKQQLDDILAPLFTESYLYVNFELEKKRSFSILALVLHRIVYL